MNLKLLVVYTEYHNYVVYVYTQVILTDEAICASIVSSGPMPGDKLADEGQFPALGAQEKETPPHPLQQHWEYIVYLFRRMDSIDENEQMMISYRDYLQVRSQCTKLVRVKRPSL